MKEEERTNKTKGKGNEINETQNWIQNQICFTSEFQRNNNGRENKEKETKEYTIHIFSNTSKAHKRNPKLIYANY